MNGKYDASVCRRLTVVIAVKTRPDHTLRWLEYAERVNFPFRVLIADGSGDRKLEKRIQRAAEAGRVAVTYRRFPYDLTLARYYGKMVSALGCCETPYCALAENDTLPVPSGLFRSVEFLLKNPKYSTCRGQYVDVRLESGREDPLPLHGRKIHVQGVYFNKNHSIWKSFDQTEPLRRLQDWARTACTFYNNVHRTETLLDGFRFLKKNKVSDIFMCDIIFSLMALSVGKSKILNEPYMMSQQNSPDGVSVSSRRKADIFERMFTPDWTRNVVRLARRVAGRLPSVDGASRRGAEQEVLSCLIRHYADRVHSHLHKRFVAEQKGKAHGVDEGDFVYRPAGEQRGFRSRWEDQFRFLLGERHA
jgi:glycosyltransferase domain-containing protein